MNSLKVAPVSVVDDMFERLGSPVVTHGCRADRRLVGRLSAAELRLIDRAVDIRRNEFAGGRACAHASLDALEIECESILARPDRSPVWPSQVVGSITHTEGYCLASISLATSTSIGLDAEVVGRVSADVAGATMTADERSWIAAAERPDAMATAVFAVKEALYKAQHPITGSWLDFGDVEVRSNTDSTDTSALLAHVVGDVPSVQHLRWPIAARWTLIEPTPGRQLVVAAVVVRAAG